jgi:hypothetical protein
MENIELKFDKINYIFPLIFVKGTNHFYLGQKVIRRKLLLKIFTFPNLQ